MSKLSETPAIFFADAEIMATKGIGKRAANPSVWWNGNTKTKRNLDRMICLSQFPVATWICRIPSTTRDKLASNSPQMTNTSAVPSNFTTKMHKSKLLRKILEPAPSIWRPSSRQHAKRECSRRNLHCQCHYSIKFYDPVNSVLLLHVARHLSFAVMTKNYLSKLHWM